MVGEMPVALKHPHSVRWLSLDYDAVNKSWASLGVMLDIFMILSLFSKLYKTFQ